MRVGESWRKHTGLGSMGLISIQTVGLGVAVRMQGDRLLIPCNDVDRRLESDLMTGSEVVDQCSTLLLLLEI